MHEFAVFIGRFQPFHTAHLATVRFAFEHAKKLIVVVGSDNQARTAKNPWSTDERIAMIRSCLTAEEASRVSFVPMRDHLYNDSIWISEIQSAIGAHTGSSDDVLLVGHKKDASSFYLGLFPRWQFIDVESKDHDDMSATKIRELMFMLDKIGIKKLLPPTVYDNVAAFMETSEFERLRDEHKYFQDYLEPYRSLKYPPTFNTVDAVVLCNGHVLVVRRGGKAGRGLIALPGGHLNPAERIMPACIRELKEETGIKLPTEELEKLIVDKQVFDHPDRSLRKRTITHAFCFHLGDNRKQKPQVKGMDDADKAWWMPLGKVGENEPKFFEDHFHIINYFKNRA